jgi:Protein of unknown function (DUF3455)
VWTFREPIATLLLDGKTVGRHYAGPNWEHTDGSAVVAKVAANTPGKTPNDIPWLSSARPRTKAGECSLGRDNSAVDQHARRGPQWQMREGRQLLQRSLLSGLRVSPKGGLILPSNCSRQPTCSVPAGGWRLGLEAGAGG